MSDPIFFVKARFIGPRFTGKLAVSAMPELIAYEKLILEMAKHIFRQEHDRQRVPAGFGKGFALTLTKIETGSNVAVLSKLPSQTFVQQSFAREDDFCHARDRVNEIIRLASSNESLTGQASSEELRLFDRFGGTLGARERVELQISDVSTDAVNMAVYSSDARKKISLASRFQYEESHEDVGIIDAANRHKNTFGFVSVSEHPRIDGSADRRVASDDVMADLARANHTQEYVRVRGVATYDIQSRLKGYLLSSLEILGDLKPNFERRLTEFHAIRAGWLDGIGEPIRSDVISFAREILRALVWDYGLEPPYLFPVEDGGVRAEWTQGDFETSVEFSPSSCVYAHVLKLSVDEDSEREWQEVSPDCVQDLISELFDMLQGSVSARMSGEFGGG